MDLCPRTSSSAFGETEQDFNATMKLIEEMGSINRMVYGALGYPAADTG